jgi:hypothetical protein
MLSQRWRPVLFSLLAVLAIWILALVGYVKAKNARMTAEKVKAFAESVDLSQLRGEARSMALRKLADMLNALSADERRKARLEQASWGWLAQMTEEEKAAFIDATMPSGFKQMIASFEELPEVKRRQTVEDSLRRLREARAKMNGVAGDASAGTNGPPVLSDELQARIRTIGLQSFYSQS